MVRMVSFGPGFFHEDQVKAVFTTEEGHAVVGIQSVYGEVMELDVSEAFKDVSDDIVERDVVEYMASGWYLGTFAEWLVDRDETDKELEECNADSPCSVCQGS